jgi:curved DNA-binding protein CbpA
MKVAEDYYALLKVPRDAPPEDIQDALRQANMKWSRRANNAPRAADRHEAERQVELVSEAKTVLTDPVRRAQYDVSIGIGGPVAPPPLDPGWPPDRPPDRPPVDPGWPDDRRDGPDSSSIVDSFRTGGGLEGWLRRALETRRRRRRWLLSRIRRRVWTGILVIFALAAFGAAGSSSSSNSPAGDVVLGIIALVIAARLSGIWKRR